MAEALTQTDRLLAAILIQGMKGEPQREKVFVLASVGLPVASIASLLNASPRVVSQQLYELKTLQRRKNKPKRK